MAAPDVVIKCEEFIENDVTPQDTDTFFNIYENADENDQENDENRRVDIDYEDDDTKMQALLREFDLEILYTILKIGDITYRSLKYISENDINAAIRSIAYRAEFREKLFAWRRDKYGLNDYSVLPPSKNTMPLGVNNSNNIQSYYTNNHHSNVVPHSRVAPNSYDHITAMAQRHSTGQTQRRRLSNQKINSAKKPRVANTMQEKQSNQATNSAQQQQHQQQQHQQQHPQQPHQQQPHQQQPHQQQPHQQQPQQHQHQPPSPTQTASRLSSQFSQGERSLTSPTPTISDTMSLLQQENSRLDSHQSMDYDDPLCYQPTTSSAAAAAAAGVPTASMKTDDSPYVPQPKMTYEKLTTGNALNCSSIQQWLEDHDKQMSCNCLKMSKFAQGHVCKAQNKSETAKIPSPDDITVAEILSTELGKKLIESYQNGGQLLHPIDRTMLVHKIVQYYIDNNMKMSVPKMKNISEQIVEMFPTENKHTYLISRGRLTPKGKLWDRYQGRMRYLKKLSCKRQAYQREMDLTAVKSTRNVKDSFKEDTDSLTEDELVKIVSTLTHDIEWNEFLVKWRQTVRYRRNDIDNKHNSKLSSILKKWPFYKWPKAPELINIDFEQFEHLISEQENLEQKWQHFLNVAPNLFKMRIKELTAKQNLNDFLELKPLLTTDAISFETIHLLHAVLKPTITCINNKRKKYSISDSQSAFTLLVSHRRDIDEELNTWKESCLRNETSRHPIVVVVGIHFHIKEFYVALDDIKWKFDSYLNALEYCFKLFYVLNLPYPRECSMVWKFVQEYLYGIKTQESLIYPMLETFIGDINALQHSVE